MAVPTAFFPMKATPYSMTYNVIGGTAGAGSVNYAAGPDINALAEGPLKVEMRRKAAAGTLTDFNLPSSNPRVRIYLVAALNAYEPLPGMFTLAWTATGLTATLEGQGVETPAEALLIEIRFIHSSKR